MKKAAVFFILIFICSFAFAELSPEETLNKYYSASSSENMQEFLSVVETEHLNSDELKVETDFVQALWDRVDKQEYEILEIRKTVTDDGKTALLNYIMTSSYTVVKGNEKVEFKGMEYVALLVNDSGTWKVSFAMPLGDYLKTRQTITETKAAVEETKIIAKGIDEARKNPPEIKVSDIVPKDNFDIILLLVLAVIGIGVLIGVKIMLAIIKAVFGGKKQQVVKEEKKETENRIIEKKPEPSEKTSKKEYTAAMKILRKRYAKGEITTDDFERMKEDLEG